MDRDSQLEGVDAVPTGTGWKTGCLANWLRSKSYAVWFAGMIGVEIVGRYLYGSLLLYVLSLIPFLFQCSFNILIMVLFPMYIVYIVLVYLVKMYSNVKSHDSYSRVVRGISRKEFGKGIKGGRKNGKDMARWKERGGRKNKFK